MQPIKNSYSSACTNPVHPTGAIALQRQGKDFDRALIGIGSNLGDRRRNILEALLSLRSSGHGIVALSRIYHSEPTEGCTNPFLNACAVIEGIDDPFAFLSALHEVERLLGRVRAASEWQFGQGAGFPHGVEGERRKHDRTIDLDLLLLSGADGRESLCLEDPRLRLPHPRLAERDFVLAPACDVASHWLLPRSRRSLAAAWDELRRSGRLPSSPRVAYEGMGGWPDEISALAAGYAIERSH